MRIADHRKALVTGAASGFGLDIARRLRANGAAVALVDIAEQVHDVAAELTADAPAGTGAGAGGEAGVGGEAGAGAGAVGVVADVRSLAAMQAAVAEAAAALGGLDTLVVSAGVFHVGGLDETSEADWDRTLDINLKGAFTTVRAAAPLLRASGRGRIVTIGSDCGRRGFAGQIPYTASKFGLIGLTESVAAELAPDGVTANCVCPVGCPTTGMGQEVLDWKTTHTGRSAATIMAATARTNPLGRNATEADVTDAVLYFISDHAGFLTGVTLDVDGGARLGSVPGAQ